MEERPRNGKITDFNKPFIEQRADPFVMRAEDGKYYFTASVPAYDKIILRCSNTLKGLKDAKEKVIWTKHESGEMSRHIWAPELHYLFGKWYIYFAASMEEDIWRLRPYILECQGPDPMKDEWIEKGKIQRSDDDIYSFDAFSLDATILENKGEYYYIWAEKVSVGIQISNIYIAKMESATKLKTAQVLLTTPDYDWERVDIWVNEGPAAIHHDGKIFSPIQQVQQVSATASACCPSMRTQICLTRGRGRRRDIRYCVRTGKRESTDRGITALQRPRTAGTCVYTMRAPILRLSETHCMTRTDIPCSWK